MSLKLIGEVALDGSGFEAGLKKLEHGAERVSDSLKELAMAAFGIYGIEAAIHKTFETAERLVNTSKRLGVGVEQLQVLEQAAKDSGTELEGIAHAFEKIDEAREKALAGGAEGEKIMGRFRQLGISVEDLQKKNASELFQGRFAEVSRANNPEILGPIFRDIFGKGFGPIITLLQTDFEELHKKMENLGLIMSAETAVKLKGIGEEFELLSKIIVVSLGPALVSFTEWLLRIISNSQVTEGLDFIARRAAGKSRLSDFNGYSADERRKFALGEDQALLDAIKKGKTFDEFKGGRQHDRAAIFADDVSKTFQQEAKYLSGIIQKVADVENEAAKGAGNDMAQLKAGIASLIAKMEADAYNLNHPQPANFTPAGDVSGMRQKIYTDSLLKTGNFIGHLPGMPVVSSNSTPELLRQQLAVQKHIAENTAHGKTKPPMWNTHSGFGHI
jgi:hypothetical protein